jgi:hypothetical protein
MARGKPCAAGSVIEYVICETTAEAAKDSAADAAALAALDAAEAAAGGGGGVAPATPAPPPSKPPAAAAATVVGKSVSERARHPSAVLAAAGALALDREWYLANQVHPPVVRLVEAIEGTDGARIAECLGLDPAKFASGGHGGVNVSAADEIFGTAVEVRARGARRAAAAARLAREEEGGRGVMAGRGRGPGRYGGKRKGAGALWREEEGGRGISCGGKAWG